MIPSGAGMLSHWLYALYLAMPSMAEDPAPATMPVPPAVVPPPPLPEPAGLPRVAYHAKGRRVVPRESRRPRQPARTGGRLGFGAAGLISGPLAVGAAFSLDALAIARVPVSRGRFAFGLFPEFGYSLLAGRQHTRGHFFTAGLGLGVIRGPFAAAVIPRAVVGALDRERAIGVRTGLLVEGSKDGGFSLEVSHEALFVPRGVIHQLRVMLSLTVLFGPR